MRLPNFASEGVVTVEPRVCVEAAAQRMRRRGVGYVVVLEERKPVGILTERDIVRRVVGHCLNPKETSVRRAMTSPVVTVRYGAGRTEALAAMRRAGVKHLPVTDEDGALCGLFSYDDVVDSFGSGFGAVVAADPERGAATTG